MKTKTKTIRGFINNSDLYFSPNSKNDKFLKNFEKYVSENLKGYKQINTAFETLKGKNATEKVIIKGYVWRGSWCDPTKETFAIFYK